MVAAVRGGGKPSVGWDDMHEGRFGQENPVGEPPDETMEDAPLQLLQGVR